MDLSPVILLEESPRTPPKMTYLQKGHRSEDKIRLITRIYPNAAEQACTIHVQSTTYGGGLPEPMTTVRLNKDYFNMRLDTRRENEL